MIINSRHIIFIVSMLCGVVAAEFSYPSRRPYSGIIGNENIPYEWNDDLEYRLRTIAEQSGPLDTQPTLIIQQRLRGPFKTSFGSPDSGVRISMSECQITTLDGKESWAGTGATPDVAWDNAVKEYRRRSNQIKQ